MNQALTVKALKVNQPIGEFFITSMGSKDLQKRLQIYLPKQLSMISRRMILTINSSLASS